MPGVRCKLKYAISALYIWLTVAGSAVKVAASIFLVMIAGGFLGWRYFLAATPELTPNEDCVASSSVREQPYPLPTAIDELALQKRLEIFFRKDVSEQVSDIHAIGSSGTDDKLFLLRVVMDKNFEPNVRNEAADLLRAPEFMDPDQWRLYVPMIEDSSEAVTNRNYAIQYLSNCYSFSSDKAAVEQKLYEYSRLETDSLGSTALLHLYQLHNKGEIKELRIGFADSAERLAKNETASVDDRMTAICILSEIAQPKHLPLLRKFATQDEVLGLKRTAIAALGERGEKADLTLIESGVQHSNFAVSLSAKEALRRYRERFIYPASAKGEE